MSPESEKIVAELREEQRSASLDPYGPVDADLYGDAADHIERLEKEKAVRFMQGYVCACSALQRGHGLDSVTKDLLSSLGKIDWKQIDEFDRESLRGFMKRRQP